MAAMQQGDPPGYGRPNETESQATQRGPSERLHFRSRSYLFADYRYQTSPAIIQQYPAWPHRGEFISLPS